MFPCIRIHNRVADPSEAWTGHPIVLQEKRMGSPATEAEQSNHIKPASGRLSGQAFSCGLLSEADTDEKAGAEETREKEYIGFLHNEHFQKE